MSHAKFLNLFSVVTLRGRVHRLALLLLLQDNTSCHFFSPFPYTTLALIPFGLPQNPTLWTPDLQTPAFRTCPCSLSSISTQRFPALWLPNAVSFTLICCSKWILVPPFLPQLCPVWFHHPLIQCLLFVPVSSHSFLSVLLVLSGCYFTQLFPSLLSIFRTGFCHLECRSDLFLLLMFAFPAAENHWATHTGGTCSFFCSECKRPGLEMSWPMAVQLGISVKVLTLWAGACLENLQENCLVKS